MGLGGVRGVVGGYSHEELFFVKKKYLPMSFINKSCNCVKPFSDFGLVLQWLMTVNRTTLQFFPKLIDFVIVNFITSFFRVARSSSSILIFSFLNLT